MIYLDPVLPKLNTPTLDVLKANPFRYGRLDITLTPNQWEFVYCREKFVAWVGGVRSSKTWGGICKSLELSRIPGNRGIVGRQFASDLEETTQRDFYELADATGMVKSRNDKKIEIYCADFNGGVLPGKPTSEILFQHLDNPKHIKGHGIGWAWPDEASEVEKEAYFRLVDRLSRKQAEGHYTVFLTSNPEGRNWMWNHFYNPEVVEARPMKDRLMHRAIHNRTKDNPFLTEEYLTNLYATAPADWIRRYAEGEFDVFEGQIYKEFSHDIHTVRSRDCRGWEHHMPPKSWPRYMGIDTGGADPYAFEIAAIDYMGNIIWYDEIYRPETYVRNFEPDLKKKMAGLTFKSIPMDNENLAAIEELRHMGIRVTKAIKRNKREGAINKLARYLHPNPTRPFPDWHPRAGQMGSPGMFFTERVPKLTEELPQQRWREINGIAVNEPDPKVPDHCLAGDTQVMTPDGYRSIKDLSGTSGLILSHEGWRQYSRCGITRKNAERVRLGFSDGTEVTCTPDHRFLTVEKEWREASTLTDAGIYVMPWQPLPSLTNSLRNFLDSATGCIAANAISVADLEGCIASYGNILTDRFHRAITSIIETTIRQTMSPIIWNASGASTISLGIPDAQRQFSAPAEILHWLSRQLKNGMAANWGSNGIESTGQRASGQYWQTEYLSPANTAVGSSTFQDSWKRQQSYALRNAALAFAISLDSITSSVRARFAAKNSSATDSIRQLTVRGHAPDVTKCVSIKSASRADTYCLTAAAPHSFAIQGGLIVHNSCDACYYVVRERPEPAQLPKIATAEQASLDIRSAYYWLLANDRKQQLREERRGYRNLAPPLSPVRHWVN